MSRARLRIGEDDSTHVAYAALLRFPFWCTYIELPKSVIGVANMLGMFAHLEWDVNKRRPELRVVMDLDDAAGEAEGGLSPCMLDLDSSGTLENLLAKTYLMNEYIMRLPASQRDEAGRQARDLYKSVSALLPVVLYLCAANAEIREPASEATPTLPRPAGRQKQFAAQQPRTWNVAWRIGAAIRRAQEAVTRAQPGEATGRTVRPHRSAHRRAALRRALAAAHAGQHARRRGCVGLGGVAADDRPAGGLACQPGLARQLGNL